MPPSCCHSGAPSVLAAGPGLAPVELLPLSRHSTGKQLERSYMRRAPECVYALKITRARYLQEEALRL